MAAKPNVPDNPAAPRVVPRHVPWWKFGFHFLFVFGVLLLFSLRVENETDYGLQRMTRAWEGNPLLLGGLAEYPGDVALANELNRAPGDVRQAEAVVEGYLDYLETQAPVRRERLLGWNTGDLQIYVGTDALVSAGFALLVAAAFYFRERTLRAEEAIQMQNDRHARLNAEHQSKIEESTRIIEKMDHLQDKLVQSEKLASVGRLSATLAHEIRNPLSIIKSSMEIVEEEVPEESPSGAALSVIREETDRMDRIITDLLNFARPKEAKLEPTALKPLVRHWLPPVVEELERDRIQLVPQLEEFDGEVLIDPDQLYQVFLNIVWNARDAVSGQPNPHIFVRIAGGEDGHARLVVRDTGVGMIPEVIQQIREPFFTTKTTGTGLGLPVSIQLMEGMKGSLEIESELEYGTTVTLRMRLAARPAASDHPTDAGSLPIAAAPGPA